MFVGMKFKKYIYDNVKKIILFCLFPTTIE